VDEPEKVVSGTLPTPGTKARYVRDLFARIAPSYDLLNHVLSLGIDILWRKAAARELALKEARAVLDVCCGTGDLALELARHTDAALVGVDFCAPMLERGARKARAQGQARIGWVQGDGLALPFPDARFDRAAVAFGVRNLADLDQGFRELARVLAPGGRLVVLEFAKPRFAPFRAVYFAYFRYVLPLIGRLVSGQSDPYTYLPESVLAFPERDELAERMARAGFESVRWRDLTFGIATLTVATRTSVV
jgi:demethylmenaquinone methyltransferase/2-methoxy-6-polyprenyl-1,4-benzoquinol methylase